MLLLSKSGSPSSVPSEYRPISVTNCRVFNIFQENNMGLHFHCINQHDKCACSDRILTCRIKSIRSPAKVGTGCYRFNYQPGS